MYRGLRRRDTRVPGAILLPHDARESKALSHSPSPAPDGDPSPDAAAAAPAWGSRPTLAELGALAAPWLLQGLLLILFAPRVPSWDDWDGLSWWLDFRDGRVGLGSIWQPHNEHRLVLVRLVLAGLGTIGLGTRTMALLGWALLAASFWLVVPLLRTSVDSWSPRRRWLFLLAASAFASSWAQWENFVLGLQLSLTVAILGIVLVARAPTSGATGRWMEWTGLVVAYLGGALWTALVPLLLGRAGLDWWHARSPTDRRRAATRLAIRIGILALLLVLYFPGRGLLGEGRGPGFALAHPLALLGFLLHFYGNPFSAAAGAGRLLTAALGTLFAAGSVALALDAWKGRLWPRAPHLRSFFLGLVVAVHSAALVIALGRAAMGPEGALASRYVSVMIIGWLAVASAALSSSRPAGALASDRRRAASAGAWRILPLAVLVLGLLVSAVKLYRLATWKLPQLEAGRACLQAVLEDERRLPSRRDCLTSLHPDPDRVLQIARRLPAERLELPVGGENGDR